MTQLPVLIVGAGWAGLAAAIELCRAGVAVHLVEAAPQAGGRARRLLLPWGNEGQEIAVDNGQHLLLGAYRETLALIDFLGGRGLRRLPMQWRDAAGFAIERRSHAVSGQSEQEMGLQIGESLSLFKAVLKAKKLPLSDRGRLIRTMVQAKLSGWRTPLGVRTVAEWYERTGQPAMLVRQFWDPLVLSAMNTPPESACAITFLRILRDALGKEPSASDFILPERDLGELFVDPAMAYLQSQQARISLRTPVREIRQSPTGRGYIARVQDPERGETVLQAAQVILATPPAVAARLLSGILPENLLAPLSAFAYRSISSAYAGWRAERADLPASWPTIFSLFDETHGAAPAHWFFDRGVQAGWRIGAMVISDSGMAQAMGEQQLESALLAQLSRTLGLPKPEKITLVHDKRATFACTPDRPRVAPALLMQHLPGLALAGDYAYGPYPATLEGAVRSGRLAAALMLPG